MSRPTQMAHTCTTTECGHTCHHEPDLGHVRTIYGGQVDYDDQPCDCEGHTAGTPEGVSVEVALADVYRGATHPSQNVPVVVLAAHLAATQYPHHRLTGQVLHVGLDELGQGRHEVVLEVVAD